MDVGATWRRTWEHPNRWGEKGEYNKPIGCSTSVVLATGQTEEEEHIAMLLFMKNFDTGGYCNLCGNCCLILGKSLLPSCLLQAC